MRLPSQPFEPRRRKELRAELIGRARVWLPDWKPRDAGSDLASAIFDVAARIESEVTERLNRMPEKTFRGFLHWLGVRGRAGQAARVPIVFQMSASGNAAVEPLDAPPAVQLQAVAEETPISLETQDALRIVAGQIDVLVAADPSGDGLYLPPAGLLTLEAPKAEPSEWQLKAPVPAGATQLQLEPELGLVVDRILREPVSGLEYRITAVDGAIVTIAPPVEGAALAENSRLLKVSTFAPFAASARNRQEHVLYIGSQDALNVEVPAVIEIVNAGSMPTDVEWSYWGKAAGGNAWIRIPETDVVQERGRLFLWKPAGPIEQTKVNEISSRWLKAVRPNGFDQVYQTSQLKLLINCEWPQEWGRRKEIADTSTPAKLEGIANTAPLVLDTPFYPLGREPRLFDAFYVGSKEAFSKPSAKVTLTFTLGDNFASPLSAVKRTRDYLIVGVGGDHKLQRLHQTLVGTVGSLTPEVAFGGGIQPKTDGGQPVELDGGIRPATAYFAGTSYVAVKAGGVIWLWQTNDDGQVQKWTDLGRPFEDGQPAIDLVLLADPTTGGLTLYALGAEGKLQRRDALHTGAWTDAGPASEPALRRLAPVLGLTKAPGQQSEAEGLVVVTETGDVYLRDVMGVWTALDVDQPFDSAVYPLVVDSGSGERYCFAKKLQQDAILACDLNDASPVQCDLVNAVLLGNAFDFNRDGGRIIALLLTEDARPAVWDAFGDGSFVLADVPVERAQLSHAPIAVDGEAGKPRYHLFAGDDGSVTVVGFEPSFMERIDDAALTDAVIFEDAADWSTRTNLYVVVGSGSLRRSRKVQRVLRLDANQWALEVEAMPPRRDPIAVTVYQAAPNTLRTGTRIDDLHLELQAGDNDPQDEGALFVTGEDRSSIVSISRIVTSGTTRTATVRHVLPEGDNADHVDYKNLQPLASFTSTVRPAVDVAALSDDFVARLSDGIFNFEDVAPARQTALTVVAGADRVILRAPWSTSPPSSSDVDVLAAFAGWQRFEPARPQNPKLSWEYFDGTAWWHLDLKADGTDNLVKSGQVEFCVPRNLQPTDVGGRPNHWIRARLVGGSYGQEKVTVITSPAPPPAGLPNGSTMQTVQRSTDDVHAPYVVSLTMNYSVCCALAPDVVLASDNHGIKDQSNINRTEGAVVEAFVPLGVMLARLNATEAARVDRDDSKPVKQVSECADCASGAPWPERDANNTPAPSSDGRAMFLGFNADVAGGPIRILFLLDDSDQEGAFPIQVDALIDDAFHPMVVKDETRGLSESGMITLQLSRAPQPTVLFGQQRRWLRLRPRAGFPGGNWRPVIRSVYANAAWAIAAETQVRERLGSSDGSPNQRVFVARPPVLDGTLKLRVREPIGRDDADALKAAGIDVSDGLGPWPGSWVLWREVPDPADYGPNDRVYALDSDTGEITFGNGLHGMVPPTGRDAIVAEQYQRGGGAAANSVTAWSEVSLVTPLRGVEGVIVPEGGAGGSDPQNAATTIRFAPANLNLRDRALSLRDVEQLALQSSAKVAQARAIGRGSAMKVVIVSRGQSPLPSSADRREVKRYLLRRSPPAWAVGGAVDVVPPRPVPIAISVSLTIDSIEVSGDVAKAASDAIKSLLDAESGGAGDGWPLGEIPSDADVAARLVEIPHVEEVNRIRIRTVPDGVDLTTLGPLAADQLPQLVAGGVDIDLSVAEEVGA